MNIEEEFGIKTDYSIKGEDFKDAEQLYDEIVSKPKNEAKQIMDIGTQEYYVSNKHNILVGIVVAILGVVVSMVGLINIEANIEWIICIIAGAIIFIVGIEQIFMKKHPVLAAFWIIWLICFMVMAFHIVSYAEVRKLVFGFNDVVEILNIVLLIYLIVMIVVTLFAVISEMGKQNRETDNSL